MSYEQKMIELGLEIPEPPEPVAAYVPAVQAGDLIYTSGQIPFVNGSLKYQGKVGENLTEEEGSAAAKICALNCLSVIKGVIGTLDNIERIVKVTGYVNSKQGFLMQPRVINGASKLLGEIFGENGRHARAAVGVNELPINAAVEIEMIVQVKS